MTNYVFNDRRRAKWAPIINTQGFKRRLAAKRGNQGLALYPGVVSDAPGVLRAHAWIAQTLSDQLKPVANTDGTVDSSAIAGDFYALLTVAGHGMNPISVPPVSNELIRKDLGLADKFASDRHRTIFRSLIRCMFARSAPAKVRLRRDASTGAPDYVNEVPKKKRELRHILDNIDLFLDLIDSGDLLALFIEFNTVLVHTTGERIQADKTELDANGVRRSRPREVNDELAARSGLREGSRFAADKTVYVNGRRIEGHFGGRRRTVYGTSFGANYLLATFCSSWRKVYLTDFAFTWKHRDPASIADKMRRFKYVVGADVKQYDQSMASWLITAFLDELENYVDRRVVKMIRLLFRAPYIVPYPWAADTSDKPFDPLFGEDPFDEGAFVHDLGLPSGVAINPDVGKLMMTFAYLARLDDHYKNVVEIGVDTILRGEHDQYALLNMSDDGLDLSNDAGYVQFCETYVSPYFKIEKESPISFLGNVPYRDDAGELKLAPNVISYLVNWLVPEHGIDSVKRRNFWAIGDRERRLHYASAPSYSAVYDVFMEGYDRHLDINPVSLVTLAYEHQRKYLNLSSWDVLVLQNPDYIHYKVDPDDLDPDILDLLVTSLPEEETWPVVSRFTDRRYQNG